ncbi:MAG: STAS domain-containing protein [Verrucomicrobiota bacterium]|nr:STAS domain-containing protein [Verrucomicrobiota bacterium]
MNNLSAKLSVALTPHAVCIKICGRANFTSSLDFKKLVSELSLRGYRKFILDLSECIIMDSTFLGVLAGIGLNFAQANNEPKIHSLELLHPNSRIIETLESLGVTHLFKICSQEDAPAEKFETVSPESPNASRAEVTRTCLEAHKTLMDLNPENIKKFKDVAEFLAEDLKKMENS